MYGSSVTIGMDVSRVLLSVCDYLSNVHFSHLRSFRLVRFWSYVPTIPPTKLLSFSYILFCFIFWFYFWEFYYFLLQRYLVGFLCLQRPYFYIKDLSFDLVLLTCYLTWYYLWVDHWTFSVTCLIECPVSCYISLPLLLIFLFSTPST